MGRRTSSTVLASRSHRGEFLRAILPLSAAVAALVLTGCSTLARRAVLPGSYLKAPANVVAESPRYELLTLHTAAGTRIVAQFGPALDAHGQPQPDYARRPTVLFFYGNRMCLAASQEIFEDFRRMGANVLIPEYPGYGMSDGVASEQECYAAADAAMDYLAKRPDIDPRRVVIAGLSIGCGSAIDLSARKQTTGVIAIVPLTNTREIGSDVAPWGLRWAVPLLARHAAFDNLSKIPRVKAPILLVRATRDQVTSATRTAELIAAATAPLDEVAVDSDHDGSWRAARSDIARWLHTHFPPPAVARTSSRLR